MSTLIKSKENALTIFFTRLFSANITEEEIEKNEDYIETIKEEEKSGATKHINQLIKSIDVEVKSEKKTKRKKVVEKTTTTKLKSSMQKNNIKQNEKDEKTR